MSDGIADVTFPQGFDTKSEGYDYSCNTSAQAPQHFGTTAQHIGTKNPLPCRRTIITLPAETVYSPTKTLRKMKTSRLIFMAAMAFASISIGNSMPLETTPKTRIDVSRTHNDIARGVKRTPPLFCLAPEVWMEDNMLHIQPVSDSTILSVEIVDADGLSVFETESATASGAEAVVSLSALSAGHYILYINMSGTWFQGEFDM